MALQYFPFCFNFLTLRVESPRPRVESSSASRPHHRVPDSYRPRYDPHPSRLLDFPSQSDWCFVGISAILSSMYLILDNPVLVWDFLSLVGSCFFVLLVGNLGLIDGIVCIAYLISLRLFCGLGFWLLDNSLVFFVFFLVSSANSPKDGVMGMLPYHFISRSNCLWWNESVRVVVLIKEIS